jgi:hypothetical protein
VKKRRMTPGFPFQTTGILWLLLSLAMLGISSSSCRPAATTSTAPESKQDTPSIPTSLPMLLVTPTPTARPPTQVDAPTRTVTPPDTPFRIAVRRENSEIGTGDLWVMEADGSQAVQLTSSGDIRRVFGWSPDNRFVLVSAVAEREQLAVVEIHTAERWALGELPTEWSEILWLDAYTVVLVSPGGIERRSVPQGQVQQKLPFPGDMDHVDGPIRLSPTWRWVAFDLATDLESDLWVLDLQHGTELNLPTDGLTFLAMWWRGDQILYHSYGQENAIWTIHPDGSQREKLIDLENWFVVSIAASADGNVLLYQVKDREACCGAIAGKLYVYDVPTARRKTAYTFSEGMAAADLAITWNGQYASFRLDGVRDPPLLVIDTQTGHSTQVCDGHCYHGQWSH